MNLNELKPIFLLCFVASIVPMHAFGQDIASAPRVRTAQFDVTYSVSDGAAPLERVELWHRLNGEELWKFFGLDNDLISPVEFVAKQEGLHELFFVITNSAGASGPAPDSDTLPHFSVFVDYTEPILQLQLARVFMHASGEPVVRLEWSAIDSHLNARPIQIAYRNVGESDWRIAKAQLPNIGLYEWTVPDDVSGNLEFRVAVTDQGGNMSAVISNIVPVKMSPSPAGQSLPTSDKAFDRTIHSIEVPGQNLSASQQHRLNQLIKRGKSLRMERDNERAVALYQQALDIAPQHADALVNLGQSLYALGRYRESAKAFQSALANAPKHPDALLGLAETLINDRQFDEAESRLLDLVASGRHDATTWLRLGDIAAYKGQSFAAHDFYTKVLTSPSTQQLSFDPIALAKNRLAELARKDEPKSEVVTRTE